MDQPIGNAAIATIPLRRERKRSRQKSRPIKINKPEAKYANGSRLRKLPISSRALVDEPNVPRPLSGQKSKTSLLSANMPPQTHATQMRVVLHPSFDLAIPCSRELSGVTGDLTNAARTIPTTGRPAGRPSRSRRSRRPGNPVRWCPAPVPIACPQCSPAERIARRPHWR